MNELRAIPNFTDTKAVLAKLPLFSKCITFIQLCTAVELNIHHYKGLLFLLRN